MGTSAGIISIEVPGSNPVRSSVGVCGERTVLASIFGGILAGDFPSSFFLWAAATQILPTDTYIHCAISKFLQLANRNFILDIYISNRKTISCWKFPMRVLTVTWANQTSIAPSSVSGTQSAVVPTTSTTSTFPSLTVARPPFQAKKTSDAPLRSSLLLLRAKVGRQKITLYLAARRASTQILVSALVFY